MGILTLSTRSNYRPPVLPLCFFPTRPKSSSYQTNEMRSFKTIGLAPLSSATSIEGSTASNTTAYVTEVVTA